MIMLTDLLDVIPEEYVVNVFHAVTHRTIQEVDYQLEWQVVTIKAPRRKQIDIDVI